ncbi:MAG: hypothetical protein IIY21_19135 [Clostridiales bacterium]|nr:hypothetical protein [Clostridiales bacterium]MBQ1572895.1 hypothetical protein [Clostridiales bacterium]
MSVRLYAYEAWKCEGEFCPQDCSRCYKAQIEADGDVTWDGFTDDNKGISESVQENDGRG